MNFFLALLFSLEGTCVLHLPSRAHTIAASMAEKVQAAHLLVKHSGSRRPSSWKENNITRSKEEALAKLEGSVLLASH